MSSIPTAFLHDKRRALNRYAAAVLCLGEDVC